MLAIIGSVCLSFEPATASVNKEDLSRFFAVVWATHPNLIPNEVCAVPEPEEQLVGVPPLFIQAEELVHSKQDVLHFRAFIHVLELHEFSLPEEDDDDGWPPVGLQQRWRQRLPQLQRGA
jgi:hypothetical protein